MELFPILAVVGLNFAGRGRAILLMSQPACLRTLNKQVV
jgi:hypothetical protein